MIKLTRIDAIMIIIAVTIILPQMHVNPGKASILYNGVYSFTCVALSFLVGVMLNQLIVKRHQ